MHGICIALFLMVKDALQKYRHKVTNNLLAKAATGAVALR